MQPLSGEGMLPLAGITVVALEQAVAAPLATRHLADLGARVIKVERPGSGDFARGYDRTVHGQSSHFVWLNRSKESLALDLKAEAGQAVLRRLLSRADVFIHNLAPGAVERMGWSSEAVTALNPRIIHCEISGYGRGGPYEGRKAYDLLIQCEAGLLSVTGTPDVPCKAGISVADIAAGMYAFSSILAALYARTLTGHGTYIEISMLEALGEWMGYPYYFTVYGGEPPQRTGSSHATIYPYGAFDTADGRQVFFGLQNDREWVQFCHIVLGDPALADDPRYRTNADRFRHRDALDAVIRPALRRMTAEELVRRLDEARIASAPLNGLRELAAHPQLRARDRWREVVTPGGPVQALVPPTVARGWGVRMDPVPTVGEHTDAILAELGYHAEEILALREAGVIGSVQGEARDSDEPH